MGRKQEETLLSSGTDGITVLTLFVQTGEQVGEQVGEVRRTPLCITEYLQLSLEEVIHSLHYPEASAFTCWCTSTAVCLPPGLLPGLQSGLPVCLPAPGNCLSENNDKLS